MSSIFEVCEELLWMYRERSGNPEFWAEPLNAVSNASFVIAAFMAWDFAIRRRVATVTTIALLSLAGTIGLGSFLFHTVPNHFTMWLDILPISLFQVFFLWLATNRMLGLHWFYSASLIVFIVGSSYFFFPFRAPLNGSLFYMPIFLAMLAIGFIWSQRASRERYLLLGAAGCFALAVIARTVDMRVPWDFGTHFLWHSLDGMVVYLALRAWIVFVAESQSLENSNSPLTNVEDRSDHPCVTT